MGKESNQSALKLLHNLLSALENHHLVGVLVPWANTSVERELPILVQNHLSMHYARLMPADSSTMLTDSFLRGLLEALPFACRQLSKLPLDAVCLACTSAGFRFPEMIEDRPNVPIVTAFDAIVDGLRALQVKRIVLLSPYPRPLGTVEEHELKSRGFEVVFAEHLGVEEAFTEVTPAQIVGMLENVGDMEISKIEAVVLSCTAWLTLDVIFEIERRFNVPAISSNLAMALYACRRCSELEGK